MPARIETVHLLQPPASLARTPEEMAWLEQLARIVNALISSGGAEAGDSWRPTTLLYPGRPFFDTHPDVGAGNGGIPIWRNSDNTLWLDATGVPI